MELVKQLPVDIANHILFMANPRLSDSVKRDLLLEATHMMLYQHHLRWNLDHVELMEMVKKSLNYDPSSRIQGYIYVKSIELCYSPDCLLNIKRELLQCGCCKRHSQGIFNEPHNLVIRKQCRPRILRNNRCNARGLNCGCPCRSIARMLIANGV